MSSGTGHGAQVVISNIPTIGQVAFRSRRVSTLQGISREAIDFSDLESGLYNDFRPGDLLNPGTFELEFLADGDGTELNRPSPASVAAVVQARNADLTLTITNLLDNTTMIATGFVTDHDGPDLETNTPMAYRLTWQSTAVNGLNPPTWG